MQCAISDIDGPDELCNALNAKMKDGFKVVRVDTVNPGTDAATQIYILEKEKDIRDPIGGAE